MNIEEHSTERLVLRKITPEVYNFVFSNYSELEQMLFLGLKTKEELTREKIKLEKGLATYNKRFLYFLLLSKESNKIIGWAGYHTWYLDHNRAEIGYGLYFEEYKRKGLMKEALDFIIPYGFDNMNLNRIEAFIGEENDASLKLIAKFNFSKEGVLKEHYLNKNIYEDSVIFGLIKKDFQNNSNK